MSEPQPDGVYPRVNAATLNHLVGKIVSLVGRFTADAQFVAADQGSVALDLSQAATDIPPHSDMAVEIVGLVPQPGVITVSEVFPTKKKKIGFRQLCFVLLTTTLWLGFCGTGIVDGYGLGHI
jgi:hypothetical protein